MFDIKALRDDPEAFDAGMARRGLEAQAEAMLASEEFVHRFNELVQRVDSENLILNDRYFASLFVERAPPA